MLAIGLAPKANGIIFRTATEIVCWDLNDAKMRWKKSLADQNAERRRLKSPVVVGHDETVVGTLEKHNSNVASFFDIQSGEIVHRVIGRTPTLESIAFSPFGKWSVMDTFGQVWDISNEWTVVSSFRIAAKPGSVHASADGLSVARLGARNDLETYSVRDGRKLLELELDRQQRYAIAATSLDGLLLHKARGNAEQLCLLPTGKSALRELDMVISGVGASSLDGVYFGFSDNAGVIRLIEISTGDTAAQWESPLPRIDLVVLSPDAGFVAALDNLMGLVELWAVEDMLKSQSGKTVGSGSLRFWDDLAADAPSSLRARQHFQSMKKDGVQYLIERITERLADKEARMEECIKNLTSDSFAVRESGMRKAAAMAPWIDKDLAALLKTTDDEELRGRLLEVLASQRSGAERKRLRQCLSILCVLDEETSTSTRRKILGVLVP